MSQAKGGLVLALALAAGARLATHSRWSPPAAPNVMLSTRFVTPLTYEAALARLEAYYEEQVGRKLAVALPEIAPQRHFEVWHDMWVFFDAGQRADRGHD